MRPNETDNNVYFASYDGYLTEKKAGGPLNPWEKVSTQISQIREGVSPRHRHCPLQSPSKIF